MMSNFEISVLFFLQLAFILTVCRLVGRLAKWIGQPQVVAEMIAGVVPIFEWVYRRRATVFTNTIGGPVEAVA